MSAAAHRDFVPYLRRGDIPQRITSLSCPDTPVDILSIHRVSVIQNADTLNHLPPNKQATSGDVVGLSAPVVLAVIDFSDPAVRNPSFPPLDAASGIPESIRLTGIIDFCTSNPDRLIRNEGQNKL